MDSMIPCALHWSWNWILMVLHATILQLTITDLQWYMENSESFSSDLTSDEMDLMHSDGDMYDDADASNNWDDEEYLYQEVHCLDEIPLSLLLESGAGAYVQQQEQQAKALWSVCDSILVWDEPAKKNDVEPNDQDEEDLYNMRKHRKQRYKYSPYYYRCHFTTDLSKIPIYSKRKRYSLDDPTVEEMAPIDDNAPSFAKLDLDSLKRCRRYFNIQTVTSESSKQELVDALQMHFKYNKVNEKKALIEFQQAIKN